MVSWCRRTAMPLLVVAWFLLATVPGGQAAPDPRVHDDAAACLAALDPAEQGGDRATSCVVGYAHPQGAAIRTTVNLQRPPDHVEMRSYGAHMASVHPFYDFTTFVFELHSSTISYDEDGSVSVSPHWHGGEIALHGGQPILVRLHFTADQTVLPPTGQSLGAGVVPCVTVDVRLVASPFTLAETLSETQTTGSLMRPALGLPEAPCSDGSRFTTDQDGITTVDLKLPPPARAFESGERIRINVAVYNEDDDGRRTALPGVRLVQGPDHLNHFVFPVADTLVFDALDLAWMNDQSYVRSNVSSPWGQYDIDLDLDLVVLGPDGNTVLTAAHPTFGDPITRYSICHGCDHRPLSMTHPWDLLAAGLEDGTYRLQVTAHNGQHTANVTAERLFSFTGDGTLLTLFGADAEPTAQHRIGTDAANTPGVAPLLVVSALLALAGRRNARA